jgi:hypothetical protein
MEILSDRDEEEEKEPFDSCCIADDEVGWRLGVTTVPVSLLEERIIVSSSKAQLSLPGGLSSISFITTLLAALA